MLRIIAGKRYNTELAELVCHFSNGRSTSDFRYRIKRLYRTVRGVWFIHHEGGAMTDMARNAGDSVYGGEAIEPVSDQEAFSFLQAHSDQADARQGIATYFASSVQDA